MTFCTNCGNKLNVGATKCDACGVSINAANPPQKPSAAPKPFSSSNPDDVKTKITGQAPNKDFETVSGATPAMVIGGQTGRVLGGRYALDQCIGSGGMGEIYRARRLHIGDTVAVKVLRPDVVENEKSRQRFYREARAAAMLHHPNAVVIHDFGEDNDGTTYIVMELLVGQSLRQVLIDEGSISALRAYGIIRQASAALDAGHRNGIVHRDIKPDNIILLDSHDGTDHIKILDFGIAKLRDKALDTASLEQRLTNMGTVIGTPHYMSPEQCQGEEADARSDIYSLGIVLYELLTGVAPFIAKTPTGIAIKHVTEQPRPLRELNPNITPAVEKVVLHALEKDPNARPQTALDLAREFELALSDEPDTARFHRTGERPAIDSVRPGNLKTEEPQKSYDTVVTPASAERPGDIAQPLTGTLPSTATSEQKTAQADTQSQKPLQTEILESDKKTDALKNATNARTELIAEPKPDPLRTNPAVPDTAAAAKTPSPAPQRPDKKVDKKVEAKPLPSPPPRPVAPQKKSNAPLLIGVGAVVLAIAGLGAWLMMRSGQKTEAESTATPVVTPSVLAENQPAPSPTSAYPDGAAPEGMVYVLGGVLRVGRDSGGEENERPAHTVTVNPFFMDKMEVTNEEYQKFIDESGYAAPPSWAGGKLPEGTAQMPITDVNWDDATAYAKWAGKRLPTEEEWEFAARGPEGRTYPWGEEWVDGSANLTVNEGEKGQLSPVGQHPGGASPFGILDLSGNVWEWTSSDYKEYPGGKITVPAGFSNLKVIRGGSYESSPKFATATLRRGWPATRNDWPRNTAPDYSKTGFRCVKNASVAPH